MPLKNRAICTLGAACVVLCVAIRGAQAQDPSLSLPNPYRVIENWAKMPEGRSWGAAGGVAIDSKGNVWVFERCGRKQLCARERRGPLFSSSIRRACRSRAAGAGMFVFPHALYIDRDDNIWAVDNDGKDGKGQQVMKFSPEGKLLLSLGTPGVTGDGPDTFNRPSGVAWSPPMADIFVADWRTAARSQQAAVVKFFERRKIHQDPGDRKAGAPPASSTIRIRLRWIQQGCVVVADRGKLTVQIFDQDGNFLDQWTQFGKPSGITIDKK